jgi:hypothetical protein
MIGTGPLVHVGRYDPFGSKARIPGSAADCDVGDMYETVDAFLRRHDADGEHGDVGGENASHGHLAYEEGKFRFQEVHDAFRRRQTFVKGVRYEPGRGTSVLPEQQ